MSNTITVSSQALGVGSKHLAADRWGLTVEGEVSVPVVLVVGAEGFTEGLAGVGADRFIVGFADDGSLAPDL